MCGNLIQFGPSSSLSTALLSDGLCIDDADTDG